MRVIVLLDVDGVIANFHEAALVHLRRQTGRAFHVDDITSWKMETCLGLTRDEQARLKSVWSRPGFASSIEPYPGAVEFVAELRKMAEVYPVTAPMSSNPTWQHEREQWLVDWFDFPRADVISTAAKHRIHGDILIDDKPETVAGWCASWPDGIGCLWTRPYNVGAGVHFLRLSNWDRALALVDDQRRMG